MKISTPEDVRTQLQQRLDQLIKRAGKIGADLRRPQNPDWSERAIETENDEVLEHLDASTLEEVRQLQAALARSVDGTYGTCSRCRGPIGDTRLAAMPFAATCIGCAS
jgi:RNA polymerase-binding transcription factor DksA